MECQPSLTLADYVERYALANDIARGTVQYLKYAVAALDAWHGKLVELTDLADDLVNRWILARLAAGLSRKTVRVQRGAILTLWRAANQDGLVETEPRKVRLVKAPAGIPQAWTIEQLTHLLNTAQQVPGTFKSCGIRRAALLRAWVLVGYYTCLRPCDLRNLRWENINSSWVVCINQSKTSWPVMRPLPQDAQQALEDIRISQEGRVFPVSRVTLHRCWYRRLKKQAGLPGSPKWLRRTGATQCEILQPGSAMSALGHKTHGLAYRHYVDPIQVQQRPVTPPPPPTQEPMPEPAPPSQKARPRAPRRKACQLCGRPAREKYCSKACRERAFRQSDRYKQWIARREGREAAHV
jgi:integrase